MNEKKLVGLDEKIYESTLDNGLKVYMWVREDVNTFYATYSIRYGAIHTNYKVLNKVYNTPPGIAHYIEHLKFNIKPNLTAHDVFYKLGSDTNAFTTFSYTNYQVLGNKEPYKNVEALIDFVQTDYFTKQLVNKERGIISSESAMGEDDPYMMAMYKSLKNVFKRSEYSNFITGSVSDIKQITTEDIERIFKDFYHPANCFIVITGNFNPYEMLSCIKENQSKKTFGNYIEPVVVKSKEIKKVIKEYEEIEGNVSTYKIRVSIKISLDDFPGLDLYTCILYSKIIMKANFGSTSDFKNDLIDKELIYNNYYSVINFDEFITWSVSVDTSYKEDVLKLLNNKLDDLIINEKTFNRIIKTNLATIILDYDDVENVNASIQNELILFNEIKYNKKEILESLSYKELIKFMKLIDFKNRSTLIIKPFEQ